MALRIQQGNWNRLDRELQNKLLKLTRREESQMRELIKSIDKIISHKIFILFEKEIPVSWSIAVYDDHDDEYHLMIYTRRSHRRRGYGKKLVQKSRRWIRKQNKGICFFPDYDSEKFWLSMFSKDVVDAMSGLVYYEEKIN